MGNEMGNNNTSEFREEDNRSPETEGKAQEPVHSNNVLKEENHVAVPIPDRSKDYHEKQAELASDDSKAAPDHTNGKEEDNRSPETVTELASHDPKAAAAAAAEDTNGKDEEEEEDMVNTTSVAIALARDPECEASAEHESTQVEVGQSEQENTNSPKEIEEIGSLVDISESNIDFNAKQKSHESHNNSEGSVVPSTILDTAKRIDCLAKETECQDDTRLSNEQLLQVENEDAKAKIETNNDGEMDSNGTNSFELQAEVDMDDSRSDVHVSIPVDKCIILTEETKLIAKESENGDSKHDADESDPEVEKATDSSTGPNCKNNENGDPTVAAHEASSNGNLQVEGMKVTEESCNQNKASEELLRESEAKFMTVHWHKSLAATPNGNKKGYSESVSTEGRSALVPELVDLTPKLSNTNGTCSKGESEDYKSKEEEPEKEQSFEIEAKEAPVLAEDQQQKTAMECEDAQVRAESTSEVKLESSINELIGAVVSPFHVTNNSLETSIPEVELTIETHEEGEARAGAVLLYASEIAETLTETKSSASENHSNEQHQEFKSSISRSKDAIEAQEDATSASNELVLESSTMIEKAQLIETVTEAELPPSGYAEQSNERTENVETSMSERVANEEQESMGNISIKSIPDSFNAHTEMRKSPSFGIENSSKLLGEVVSPFHVTNNSMETLIPEADLSIEKLQESEAIDASEITETLTETKCSASKNHSSEQHQEFKSTMSKSRDGIEAQEDETSASNVLVPESSTTIEKPQLIETVTEADLPASGYAEQSNKRSEKVETSMAERVVNEEQESTGRFSIESIPDSFNARAELRKSPSFGIDLRIEARNEESDHTPLLPQNMNTNEDDVTLQTSLLPVEYNQQFLKDQPFPPEEKVITTLKRSDSEKSRTPLFEQQNSSEKDSTNPKNTPSSSKVTSKSKEKHKRRSSLFTNCMCCTTVMN